MAFIFLLYSHLFVQHVFQNLINTPEDYLSCLSLQRFYQIRETKRVKSPGEEWFFNGARVEDWIVCEHTNHDS